MLNFFIYDIVLALNSVSKGCFKELKFSHMDKLFNYLKGARAELAKVVWPSRQVTINHTAMVIVISVGVALFLGAIDFGLSKVLEILIIR